jgi:hypothetical protein
MKTLLRFIGMLLVFVGFGHSYLLHLTDLSFWGWTVLASVGCVMYGENYND